MSKPAFIKENEIQRLAELRRYSMPKDLTNPEARIMLYVQGFYLKHKRSPTAAEVQQFLGAKSCESVYKPFRALADKNYIEYSNEKGWREFNIKKFII